MATTSYAPLARFVRSICPAGGDAQLLACFTRRGDEAAFAELVRRHGPAVLGVCRRVLHDEHAAEDAFQATFLLLARKAGSLRCPEQVGCWLHGVAYRTALKLRGRLARRAGREQPLDETVFAPRVAGDADLGPALDAAIEQLPAKYRLPVVLCYLQGLSNAEAAAALGCPANTVATRLARARQRLRGRLTRQGLTAAVSAALVAATAGNAAALVAGAAAVSPEILTLMEGVRTAMLWQRTKLIVAAVAILALGGFGASHFAFRAAAEQPMESTPAPTVPAAANPPARDRTAPGAMQIELSVVVVVGPASMLARDDIKALMPRPSSGHSGPASSGVLAGANAVNLMSICREKAGATLLAEPRLVTLSGRPARFQTGRQVAVPDSGGITYRPVGLELQLLPILKSQGRIYLEAHPTIRAVNVARGTQTAQGFMPGFDESTARTAMELRNGETALIRLLDTPPLSVNAERPGRNRADEEPQTTLLLITPRVLETPAAIGDVAPRTAADTQPRIPPVNFASAQSRSHNFIVSGTTEELGLEIASAAESLRTRIAELWLGKQLPAWPQRCPIEVTIDAEAPTSATAFEFGQALPGAGINTDAGASGVVMPRFRIIGMRLTGSAEQIMANSLPHEITHTVLADHFRRPIPRWADEGAAALAESGDRQKQHDQRCRQFLSTGTALRLTALFGRMDYPDNSLLPHVQGHSVTRFLVARKDRATFLEFVRTGMTDGWEAAAKRHYDFRSVGDLEEAWIAWLRSQPEPQPLSGTPTRPAPIIPAGEPQRDPPATGRPGEVPGAPPPAVIPPRADPVLQPPPSARQQPASSTPITVVQASVDKEGLIVCRFPRSAYYEPVTAYRVVDGVSRPVTSYVRRTVLEERAFHPEQLQAIGSNGKPVAAQDLVKRLATETTVLLVDDLGFDAKLLTLLKAESLIICPTPGSVRPPPIVPR